MLSQKPRIKKKQKQTQTNKQKKNKDLAEKKGYKGTESSL